MKYVVILLFMLLLFVGCSVNPPVKSPPVWIDNPQQGVSASSGMHVKGRHYQQELAIIRAREQLAARMGVEVSSIQTVKEQVTDQQASIRSDKVTQLIVKNQLVRAQVREVWLNNQTGHLWVWLYPLD